MVAHETRAALLAEYGHGVCTNPLFAQIFAGGQTDRYTDREFCGGII
jgi:hypothetical protein